MSRRCKAGQRAKVIDGNENHGAVVLVLRPYFGGRIEDGNEWPKAVFHPWVVVSLGAPLAAFFLEGGGEAPSSRYAVMEDRDLEPLDDDDDGLDRSTEEDKPVAKPVEKARKPEAACT